MTSQAFAALLILALGDPAATSRSRSNVVMIVNAAQPIASMSRADLRHIYLGEITRWPGGHRIIPVVLPPNSPEQRLFLDSVVQMGDIDYAQRWIGQVFRGEAAAPPHLAASSAEARRFVAGHPYAIAFISPADLDSSVRALAIDGKAPDAADDPLAR